MKRLTVVFIVSTLGQTGPTRQLINIVKHLNTDRFRPSLITLSPEPKKTLKNELQALNVPIYSLGLGRIRGFLYSRTSLLRLIARIDPDIIHTQGIRADLLSAKLPSFPARLTTQRNNPEQDYPPLYGSLIGTYLASTHRNALSRIPYVVACSTPIAENNMKRGMHSFVITNGVDLEWCPTLPTKEERLSARVALDLKQDGHTFMYAGPMIPRKNPIYLIKSFCEWEKESQHQLWILGDGPLIEKCRQLAWDHPNIFIPGHISDIRCYLRAADVFVSASISEGLPNAALEALSFGLPQILSDIPSHREIIKSEPTAGCFFSLEKPGSLANAFNIINISEQSRLAARRLAELNFSANVMTNKYMNLYESIYN